MLPRTSSYVEETPAPSAIAAHLECVWVGEVGDDRGFTDRVLPDACIDVIWDGTRLFVAGPDTGPVIRRDARGSTFSGVRFKPGHAPAVLGVTAAALRDLRVDAHELWGPHASRVEHDLLSRTPRDAARVLERHVASLPMRDDATAHADAVRRRALLASADAIADDLGVTTRTLHRRCVDAFGYGPKTLQRVLRFRRFLTLAERSPDASLARLAADAGYADQPHLNHESQRLSGLTPLALLVSRGVRSVQDGSNLPPGC